MKDFKKLRIWQNGFTIAINAFRLVESFPKTERYGLASQITRAAVSIPSNIAEGSGRSSERDYARFLQIALGSSFELETHILIADSLDFGDKILRASVLTDIEQEYIMLHSFLSKLNK